MESSSTERFFNFQLWLGVGKTGFEGTKHYWFRRQPPRWLVRFALMRGWGVTLLPIPRRGLAEQAYLSWEPTDSPKAFLEEQLSALAVFSKQLKSLEIDAKSLTLDRSAIEVFAGLKTLGLNCKLNPEMDFRKLGELEVLSCFDPSLFGVKSLRTATQIKLIGCVGYRQNLSDVLPDSIVRLQLIRGLPPEGLSFERFTELRSLVLEVIPSIDLLALSGVERIEELVLSKFSALTNLHESLPRWKNLRVIKLDGIGVPWDIAPEVRAMVPAEISVSINGREL